MMGLLSEEPAVDKDEMMSGDRQGRFEGQRVSERFLLDLDCFSVEIMLSFKYQFLNKEKLTWKLHKLHFSIRIVPCPTFSLHFKAF